MVLLQRELCCVFAVDTPWSPQNKAHKASEESQFSVLLSLPFLGSKISIGEPKKMKSL